MSAAQSRESLSRKSVAAGYENLYSMSEADLEESLFQKSEASPIEYPKTASEAAGT